VASHLEHSYQVPIPISGGSDARSYG